VRVAYWNRFAMPAAPVQQGVDFDLWWATPAAAH
jgi:hypothetical protein